MQEKVKICPWCSRLHDQFAMFCSNSECKNSLFSVEAVDKSDLQDTLSQESTDPEENQASEPCRNSSVQSGDGHRGSSSEQSFREQGQAYEFFYKLDTDLTASNPRELGSLMLKHPDLAKKHLKQQQFYDSFNLYDQALASRLQDIRKRAASLEERYIEVVYTLNPKLPYRLMEDHEARTPAELARLIDRDRSTWQAGREQLYNGSILAWLRAVGYQEVAGAWEKVAAKFFSTQASNHSG